MSFKDKVVIVTGAGSGMGASTAIKFSEEGAYVVLVDKDKITLTDKAKCCQDSLAIHADVTNDEDNKRIIDLTVLKFKKIDVLVNNAGIITAGTIMDGTIMKSYTESINVNLRAAVTLTTLAAPYLLKTKGCIVNISSSAPQIPYLTTELTMYAVSKAALNAFTISSASELGSYGVRVNAISPGPVNTNVMRNSEVNIPFEKFKKETALNRISEPDEIADLVLYLASAKAKGITGSNILADNGYLLRSG